MQTVQPRQYPGNEQGQVTSYPELLSRCLRNCADAYNVFALEGQMAVPQVGLMGSSQTHPDPYRYMLSVRVLWAHIKEEDRDFKSLRELWDRADHQGKKKQDVLYHDFGPYEELHHWILQMIEEKQLLSGKVRRSLVGA